MFEHETPSEQETPPEHVALPEEAAQSDEAATSEEAAPAEEAASGRVARSGLGGPSRRRAPTASVDHSSTVDLDWARKQTPLAVVGTLISVLALAAAVVGRMVIPLSAVDAEPFAITAVIGAVVLAAGCVVVLVCWLIQLRRWRTDPSGLPTGRARWHGLALVSLVAHLVTYAAVLVTMYGAIAASARAFWDSLAATLLGVTFLLAIFGQILGGTQLLRNDGPPATVPFYARRLNTKVQSLR